MPVLVAYLACALSITLAIGGLAFHGTAPDRPKLQARLTPWLDPIVIPPRGGVPLSCGPTWCAATNRWRDPATKKFVKAPIIEASAGE